MAKIRARLPPTEMNTPTEKEFTHRSEVIACSQPLPTLAGTPLLHARHYSKPPSSKGSAPATFPRIPKFLPGRWVYTDGSHIKGRPRFEAVVVHIPTNTTIFMDDAGTEETRTIMRAKLVAIHTALTTFASH